MKKKGLLVILSLTAVLLAGCATIPQNSVSQYTADKEIKKGITTKQDVLKIFGPPNITTTVPDYSAMAGVSVPEEAKPKFKEIWTYSKMQMNTQGIVGGAFLSGLTLGLVPFASSVSSKTVMLQIFFDQEEKVIDYSVTTMQF